MVEVEGCRMSAEPPPDWYLRQCERLALQGLNPSLPTPEPEPSNVFDIRAERTKRATALMIRRRGEL
jgi:hypothetical protein